MPQIQSTIGRNIFRSLNSIAEPVPHIGLLAPLTANGWALEALNTGA